MISKEKNQKNVVEMRNIVKKYDFYHELSGDIDFLESFINEYNFRIILIGGFSSGKSALLNKLIGRDIFKENQGPETSVPAEISYADEESALAVFDDGHVENFPVDGLTATPPQKVSFLKFTLDNPFLKARPDLTFVDFPGFDSKVEAHNKAISSYLYKGSAFILLVQAQNGTLTESDRQFVKEAMQYPQGLACLISQTDLVLPDEVKDILDGVRKNISALYGTEVPVDTISIQDERNCFEEKIAKAVDRFNPQDLFESAIAAPFATTLDKCINTLQCYIDAQKLDLREIEAEIVATTERMHRLEKEFEKQRKELDREYIYQIIPDIMDKAETALRSNMEILVRSALSGGHVFAENVQCLLRPVLNAVPGVIHANLRDVIGHMDISIQARNPKADENFKNSLIGVVDAIASLPALDKKKEGGAVQVIKAVTGPLLSRAGSLLAKTSAGTAFAGVGGAVATFLTNPIVGVIVGIAPAVINLFFSAKAAQQPDPQEQARFQVETQLPLILNSLHAEVEPAVLETRDMMLAEIQARISENIAAEASALEAARKRKQQEEAVYAQTLAAMQQDMEILQKLQQGQEF